MTTYSKGGVRTQVEVVIAGLERCSFYDCRDRIRAVEVGCRGCGKIYYEELEAAKGKVTGGLALLCLSCDDDAEAVSCVGVTAKGGRE